MDWAILTFLLLIIIGFIIYNYFFNKPKNSVQLYEEIALAEDVENINDFMVDGYEGNFKSEDIAYIQDPENTAKQIRQLTPFEYDDRTFVMSTTLATKRLEVYAIEELPKDIRAYITNMAP